ncbi:Negative elongation factor A [Zootermopsis nevadensis]|uniref:Negative elongation factor A n=1 Tax=Zootermopsis nevadensis TaxID=136037 RepID=A0A067RNB2_ZOONE|nr:Negative elongation factor A [Zootermopsis nevadensis]
MANVRDSDTSLWLHNKLGTSNDSWTGGSICSQLNAEVLRNIKDCFPDLQTQVKLKLLLSFFHIPRRNVEEWHTELEEILEVAQVDSEQWVSMLAEVMKTLPSTGSLNTSIGDVDENRRIFSDLVNDLRKLVKRQCDMEMLPLECHYLNKSALISVVGQQPPPTKHFTLKRKPKSAALRAELLQKSADAASNLKKSTAPTVPVRSRGMPRKMTDTTPLKGIPSRVPAGGFRSPSLNSPSMSRPPMSRTPAGRKDGGIKLLDINEQPLGYAQAKKRKRMQELEEARKASEAAAAQQLLQQQNQQPGTNQSTPDYAVGLTAMNPPTPAPATPSYSPATPQHTLTTIIAIPRDVTGTPATPSYAPLATPTTLQVIQIRSAPQVAQMRIQAVSAAPGNNTLQRKGLSLTREQMLEAQEMFRTANKVTRPEKALILGFMAGSRDNPCPHLGNIVTIKLSEDHETVPQSDDTFVTTTIETHFQMNYNTGEWKRIKKIRKIEDLTAVAASSTHASTPLPATSAAAT